MGRYKVGGVGSWGHQCLERRKDTCLLNKDSHSWPPVAPERATCDQRGPQDSVGPEIQVLMSDPPLALQSLHVFVREVGCSAGLPAPRVTVGAGPEVPRGRGR